MASDKQKKVNAALVRGDMPSSAQIDDWILRYVDDIVDWASRSHAASGIWPTKRDIIERIGKSYTTVRIVIGAGIVTKKLEKVDSSTASGKPYRYKVVDST